MLTLIFFILLIAFTIWWKQDVVRSGNFMQSARDFSSWWRKLLIKWWFRYNVRDGVLHVKYGRDHETFQEMYRTVNPQVYNDIF